MDPKARLIVALDVDSLDDARRLVEALAPHAGVFKIGSTLFTREGPRACQVVKEAGARLFLDLKYHDIPNQVAGAVRAALALGCDMLTLHASGGAEMIRAARREVDRAGRADVILLAVTVLTSFAGEAFASLFQSRRGAEDTVAAFAKMAREAGATGVVASAREARLVKSHAGADLVVVTPGIRLPGAEADDQVRVLTPEAAIAAGADYLVVGRPIVAAPDPAQAARAFLDRIGAAR
ncbi:MAG: orotidine-5'-phosphate decarboxylase [Candidatus Krumholzibacteria bacterium]|nr:orotidine-5'-phosphate decarboxylase [Candidatus Krumholzibacteria bacterium]